VDVVGHPSSSPSARARLRKMRAPLPGALPAERPQRPGAAERELVQLVLVQPISGETSRLARLRSSSGWTAKRHGGEQVLHRQRRGQVQPVDAGHRHAFGEQPRDDQRGQLAAAADQDQDVAGAQRPPVEASTGASSSQALTWRASSVA
jgi:hypothetical protein